MLKDSRKVAAILAADVVGYTQLMGADEAGALSSLKVRRAIFDRLVKEYDGQEFGSVGDSLMAQFPSAVNAVRCARNIQHAIAEENESLPVDRRMLVRIGVNLGDVIEENGALYGDGVNIAARLQSMATPGGVLISGAVREQVKNKLSATFRFIGARHVKNVSEPVPCYEVSEPAVTSRFSRRHLRWFVPMVAAILAFAMWQWWSTADTESATNAGAKNQESIAVLPFVDLSAAKDQEYFSDGVAEELLNLLTKVPELRVISRSSAFSFKSKDVGVREIAKRLNVAHILEGSVRMAGNRVRITARLIDARTDTDLWSETYDRTLEDIFAVQEEIAAAVVARLKITLLGATPSVEKTDPRAYALTLQARQLDRLGTKDGWERSEPLLRQAVAIDPGYAEAWLGLASIYISRAYGGPRPFDEAFRLAREATNKALAIHQDDASAYAQLAQIARIYDNDLAAAARNVERALALEPDSPVVIGQAAILSLSLGRVDQAIALQEYAVAHDPLNSALHADLGRFYRAAGRFEESIASFHTALGLSPGGNDAHAGISYTLLLKDEPKAALDEIQQEPNELPRLQGLAMDYHALGREAQSEAALADLIAKYGHDAALNIASVLAFRGEANRAFEWLDEAVAYHDTGLGRISVSNPLFANVHDDPRWPAFLQKLGRAPEQLAAINFTVALPGR